MVEKVQYPIGGERGDDGSRRAEAGCGFSR